MSDVDTLTKIGNLQNTEKQLIDQLTALTSSTNTAVTGNTSGNALQLIEQIQNTSAARIALFKSISDKADVLQAGVANSRTDLVSQMTLLGVIEDQLNQAKSQINTLQNHNDTQMRLVEVNTYYGKQYEAQIIILICTLLLILFILKKKGLVPELISKYAIGITIAVGAIFVIREVWDIYTRSNMNFDEYNWKYEDPTSHVPSIWQYNKDHMFDFENPIKDLIGNLGLCVGENCCADGLVFNAAKQQCMIKSTAAVAVNTAEAFISQNLNGSTIRKIKDLPMDGGVAPFSEVPYYTTL